VNWDLDDAAQRMLSFTRWLVQIRTDHPMLHRRRFFQGRSIHGSGIRDIIWLRPDGGEMDEEEWNNGLVRCLGMMLNGQEMDDWDERGEPVRDDILILLLNAYHDTIPFKLPGRSRDKSWTLLIDTSLDASEPGELKRHSFRPGRQYDLQGRSLALLMQPVRESSS
jgi:glycogen operon protein